MLSLNGPVESLFDVPHTRARIPIGRNRLDSDRDRLAEAVGPLELKGQADIDRSTYQRYKFVTSRQRTVRPAPMLPACRDG